MRLTGTFVATLGAPADGRAPMTLVEWSSLAALLAFLYALLRPTIPTPFLLEPATAWIVLCYTFAVPVIAIQIVRGSRLRITPFDYLLGVYFLFTLATWPTSFDPRATGIAILRLCAQIVVFYSVRLLCGERPALRQVTVALFISGIAVLEWAATAFHLRYGLVFREIVYPSLEWNGREGLGVVGAIQFALLFGIWQQARSHAVWLASTLLLIASVIELLFLYSRIPWIAAAAVLAVACVMTIRVGGFRRYLLAIGIVVAVVGLLRTPYIVHLAQGVAGVSPGAEGGPERRLGLWRNAVQMIGRHPFAGVGLDNFVAVHGAMYHTAFPLVDVSQGGWVHPHNIFLQQTAETGILGGVAYLALWMTALWAGWRISTRLAHTHDDGPSLFYALVAIVIANMGENIFLDAVAVERIRLHTIAWILMALVMAAWDRLRAAEPSLIQHAS